VELPTLLTGLGATLLAFSGLMFIIHELRRQDKRDSNRQINELSQETYSLREDVIAWERYSHQLRERLAAEGMEDLPVPPPPHKIEIPAEPKRKRQWWRLLRRGDDE